MSDPLPISALEHHAYCPRQAALIHIDGLWFDNQHTVRGTHQHRRADEGKDRLERGRTVLRGIPLWSERLNLTGRADVVEFHDDGRVVPVEYKIGTRHGDAAAVQLCAQGLCLEEMLGVEVLEGYIWYARFRRRDLVSLDATLRARTERLIEEVARSFKQHRLPRAVDDARCSECQLRDVCMPTVTADPLRIVSHVQDLMCAS